MSAIKYIGTAAPTHAAPIGSPFWRSDTKEFFINDDGSTAWTKQQPGDADLTAIAALVSAADKMPYATGAGAWALADLTTVARTLLDDTTIAAMLATLGLTHATGIGNQYFAAKQTSAQAISASTHTKINYAGTTHDPASEFNATLDRYLPLVAGDYLAIYGVTFSFVADQKLIQTECYKNGVFIPAFIGMNTSSTSGNTDVSAIAACIETLDGVDDYFEHFVWINEARSTNDGGGQTGAPFFMAIKIG